MRARRANFLSKKQAKPIIRVLFELDSKNDTPNNNLEGKTDVI